MRKFFKYFAYTLVFMVMSIVSAYGAVTISMNNASKMQNDMMNSGQEEPLPEQLTSIYENIAKEDAMQINLSANIASSTQNYIIDLLVNMDTSQGYENLALDGRLKIAGNSRSAQMYDIDFSYQNGMAYFDMFNGRLAIDTTTIVEPIMSIMDILGIEMPSILNMDLSTLTPEVILGMLTNFTEEIGENGINLEIDVPVVGKLNLVCDFDYNITEFSLPTLEFGENTSFSLSSDISYPDFVEIKEKIESDYVKVGNLLNVAEVVLDSLNGENVGFDFSLAYDQSEIEGKLYADLVGLSALASIDIAGNTLKLFAIDNIIYIEFANIFASFALDDFEQVNNLLKNQFGIDIPLDKLTRILTSIKNGNFAEVLNEFDLNLSPSNIDLSILESVTVKNNLTAIKVRDIGDFGVIIDNDNNLKRLAFSGQGIEAVLETRAYEKFELAQNSEDYIDLALLLPTVENAISIFKSNTLSGQINVKVGEIELPFNYAFRKENSKVYGSLQGDVLGATLKIDVLDNKVYISFADSNLIVINLDTLQNDINSFLAELELNVDLNTFSAIAGVLGKILNTQTQIISGLSQTEKGFVLSTANGIEITATNSSNEIEFSSDNNSFSFKANLIGSDTQVEMPTINGEFAPFEDMLEFGKAFVESGLIRTGEGILNYFLQGNLGLNLNVNYAGNEIYGSLNVNLQNKEIKFAVDINGKELGILLLGREIYIEHGNIFVKFDINNLTEVERFLKDSFNIELPLGKVIELLDMIESESPLAVFGWFGLSLNLANLDLAFFDGISVDGNVTTISIDEIGTIKITLTDKILSNVEFVGNEISASVDFVEFKDFTLTTSNENYVDVVKFLPTIQNGIDIFESNTISGQIDVTVDNTNFVLDYLIEKRDLNDVYAEISTEFMGASINAIYMNNKVYVNFADCFKLAVDVNSLPEALEEFLTAINLSLDVDANESLTNALGLIASVIYDNSTPLLITGLTEKENGLDIEVFNGFTLSIVNGLAQMNLVGNFDNISANISIIGGDLSIDRPQIDESQFNQFESVLALAEKVLNSGLVDVAEGAYNYASTGKIGLSINANYQGQSIVGTLDFNLENLALRLNAKVDEFDVSIILLDEVIYLEIGNVYAKFALENIDELEEFLNTNFGISLPIDEMTNKFEEISSSDKPLENLSDLGIIDLSVISLAFFDGISVDGNVTTISIDEIGTIKITLTDKILSNVEFVGNEINASVDFVEFKYFGLSTSNENYVDVVKFLPTIQNGIDIFESNTISGQIDVTVDDTNIVLDYLIEKRDLNDVYSEISTEFMGASINAIYMNNKVYVNFADCFKLAVDVNSLPEALEEFLTAINISLDVDANETLTNALGLIASVIYDNSTPLLITGLTEKENGLDIEVFNGLTLSIVNGLAEMKLVGSFENINASISIIGGDLSIDRPQIDESQFNQFESVLALAEKVLNSGLVDVAEGAYNYFKNGIVLGLNFTANYQNTQISGKVMFDLDAKQIKVSVVYDGIEINVIVLDKVAYVEFGNIYLKFAVADLDRIEKLLLEKFNIDIPLSQIIDIFEETTTPNDKPLENLSDLGLIDLSIIDLAFFDGISVDGNVTTISIDEIGTIKVTLNDQVLTTVDFAGYEITANANFVSFEEIKLSLSEETYIDLIKLLPTIENAIDIVESPTISGTINLNDNISVDFAVNKEDLNNIYAEAYTQIQGANIKLMYLGGKVYIHFAETIKLVADFETLPETIENLLAKADVAFEFSDNIDLNSLLDTFFSLIDPAGIPILITALEEKENNSLAITLHDNTTITLNNLSREIDFSIASSGLNGLIIGNENPITIPTIDNSLYTPLDDVLDLVEAFLNMAKLDDFHISGTFDIVGTLIGIDIKWNIPFDVKISNKNGFEMMMTIGPMPVVVGLNNDVPFVTGDTNGGKNRYFTVYVKDGDIYLYRVEEVNRLFGMSTRKYEKCTKITAQTFFADPMKYVQYAIGFGDSIMSAIADSVSKATNREAPINLNNVVNSLTVVNDTSFTLVLNAAELANNTDLDTLTLNIGIGYEANGESYLSTLGLQVFMPLASVFELTLTTSDTHIVNYGSPVDMSALYDYVNNYKYAYDAEWEASDGKWSKANEVLYTITFEENGGESVPNISGAYGTEITLPNLAKVEIDNGVAYTIMTFAGWYSTSTFDEGSEFVQTTMPKGDTTLYAKWDVNTRYYRTISFVTNSTESASSIVALEGSDITLPVLSLKTESTETTITVYSFEGWYTDAELTQEFNSYKMPNEDITLYAKWEVANIEEAHLLEIYDNGTLLYSKYILAGETIDLSKVGKINDNTLIYLMADYSTLYEGDFTMPEENLTLHIRNQYLLKYTSEYGTVVNSEEYVWQGASISIPSQSTYYDDDYKTRQITYAFNGYKINGVSGEVPSVMPNSDTEIVAEWSVTTKKYYTISFDTTWVKPDAWFDNNSNFSGKITCKTPAGSVGSLLLLEGTTLDTTPYYTTARYAYKAVWVEANYDFKVLAWNTEGVKNISDGATNGKYSKLTNYVVTGNATLYATWGVY